MATVTGIAYWASIIHPNTRFDPKYCCDLVVDEETAQDYRSRGFDVKEKEYGPTLIFKRNQFNRKTNQPNSVPKLKDRSGKDVDVEVGNGSEVRVQYAEWTSNYNGTNYQGLDLQGLQILKLVERETTSDGEELDALDPISDDDINELGAVAE